jgi:hypothetical protein
MSTTLRYRIGPDMTMIPVTDGEDDLPSGVISALGEMGPGAIITERGLGGLFERSPDSVKRAVEKGHLPPPTRLFGQNIWTAGVLVKYLEERQREAAQAAEEERAKGAARQTKIRQIITKHAP